MPVKVFILGRPGSGKSTAARLIVNIARCRNWSAARINDFDILQAMFQADRGHKQFCPTENGGFNVTDFSVLDMALGEVEKRVKDHISLEEHELVTIEFARDDYSEALKSFSRDFLQDGYFLFIDADIETCIQRIHKRIKYTYAIPPKPDNHFVSDEILRGYYSKDNRQYIQASLRTDYSITKWIEVIENMDSWINFRDKICDFVDIIFWQERKLASGSRSWSLLELNGAREL